MERVCHLYFIGVHFQFPKHPVQHLWPSAVLSNLLLHTSAFNIEVPSHGHCRSSVPVRTTSNQLWAVKLLSVYCLAGAMQRSILPHPPDSGPCGVSYVGQTGRLVSIRVAEHKCHIRLGQTGKSETTQHCWASGNQAQFAETRVLWWSDSGQRRLIRESLEIALTARALNQEDGAMYYLASLLQP